MFQPDIWPQAQGTNVSLPTLPSTTGGGGGERSRCSWNTARILLHAFFKGNEVTDWKDLYLTSVEFTSGRYVQSTLVWQSAIVHFSPEFIQNTQLFVFTKARVIKTWKLTLEKKAKSEFLHFIFTLENQAMNETSDFIFKCSVCATFFNGPCEVFKLVMSHSNWNSAHLSGGCGLEMPQQTYSRIRSSQQDEFRSS